MITLDTNHPPAIPASVAVCPICGAPIEITEIYEWETETGKVTDGGMFIDCSTAPDDTDFDTKDFDNHLRSHWSMPYVDWMPVADKVLRWLNAHYRIPEVER